MNHLKETERVYIWVTFEKEGIHRYPLAPEEVKFLRDDHRHIFKFKVMIEVNHDDRDIEFILFKRELQNLYKSELLTVDYKSCEMMARDIAEYLNKQYPGRSYEISVSEDGENGAILTKKVTET